MCNPADRLTLYGERNAPAHASLWTEVPGMN